MTTWGRKRRSSGTGVQPKKKTISTRSQRPNERRSLFRSKRYHGSKGEEGEEDNNGTSMLTMTSSSSTHKEKMDMIDNSSTVILPLMTTLNANNIFPRMAAAAAIDAASPIDIAPKEGIISSSKRKSSREQQQKHVHLLPDDSFVESLDSLESLFSPSNSISMESLETLPPFSPLTPTPFKKSVAVAGGQLRRQTLSKPPAEQSLQVTSSENDTELQSALDSLGRNLKELRQLDSPAGDSNTSGVFSEFSKDDGYDEFLSIIKSNESFIVEVADAADATLAAVEAAFGSPAGGKEGGVVEDCGKKELENEISKLEKSSECEEDAGVGSEEDPREEQVVEDTFNNETMSETDLEKEEEEDTILVPGDGANSNDINASDAIAGDGMKPKDSLGEKIMADITTVVNQNLITNELDAGKAKPNQDGAMEEESSSNGDVCGCLWFPEPLLALLRGGFNANNHTRQSAITTAHMPPQALPQAPPTKASDNSIRNVEGKMQQSVESLRADVKAMMDHAAQLRMLSSTHDEQLILGEIRVIEKSLDKISSSWLNSTEEK